MAVVLERNSHPYPLPHGATTPIQTPNASNTAYLLPPAVRAESQPKGRKEANTMGRLWLTGVLTCCAYCGLEGAEVGGWELSPDELCKTESPLWAAYLNARRFWAKSAVYRTAVTSLDHPIPLAPTPLAFPLGGKETFDSSLHEVFKYPKPMTRSLMHMRNIEVRLHNPYTFARCLKQILAGPKMCSSCLSPCFVSYNPAHLAMTSGATALGKATESWPHGQARVLAGYFFNPLHTDTPRSQNLGVVDFLPLSRVQIRVPEHGHADSNIILTAQNETGTQTGTTSLIIGVDACGTPPTYQVLLGAGNTRPRVCEHADAEASQRITV
ncbi:hypothetical protein PANDA_006617 [Ailuropoda melanoleuca]|uniref:Uncharacterized protein n=1 Tax=Ailuropoda melanoleuca TaxID=9646 RepID=D2H8N9_AILME|nr:hypothetical protein PANDA_006617 [Ailuropoda melanoleuca]